MAESGCITKTKKSKPVEPESNTNKMMDKIMNLVMMDMMTRLAERTGSRNYGNDVHQNSGHNNNDGNGIVDGNNGVVDRVILPQPASRPRRVHVGYTAQRGQSTTVRISRHKPLGDTLPKL